MLRASISFGFATFVALKIAATTVLRTFTLIQMSLNKGFCSFKLDSIDTYTISPAFETMKFDVFFLRSTAKY